MDLKSIVIGFVGGWLVQWALDMMFYRRETGTADTAEWQRRLEAAQAETARLRVQLEGVQPQLDELKALKSEAGVSNLEAERDRLRVDLVNAQAESQSLRAQLDRATAGAVSASASPVTVATKSTDPLAAIVGFGEDRRAKLHAAGVTSLADVAALEPARLLEILGLGDDHSEVAEAWIEEARGHQG